MAMLVLGRKPNSKAGKRFQANIWEWRPVYHLTAVLCADLLGDETCHRMAYNVGAGPEDQRTCTMMAERLKWWHVANQRGFKLETEIRIDEKGNFVRITELANNPRLKTDTPYKVTDERIREWMKFLRHCGGFEVW